MIRGAKTFEQIVSDSSESMQRAIIAVCHPCRVAQAFFESQDIDYTAEDVLRLGKMIASEARLTAEATAKL